MSLIKGEVTQSWYFMKASKKIKKKKIYKNGESRERKKNN